MRILSHAAIGCGPDFTLALSEARFRSTVPGSDEEAFWAAECARGRHMYWQSRRGRLSRLGCEAGRMNGGADVHWGTK